MVKQKQVKDQKVKKNKNKIKGSKIKKVELKIEKKSNTSKRSKRIEIQKKKKEQKVKVSPQKKKIINKNIVQTKKKEKTIKKEKILKKIIKKDKKIDKIVNDPQPQTPVQVPPQTFGGHHSLFGGLYPTSTFPPQTIFTTMQNFPIPFNQNLFSFPQNLSIVANNSLQNDDKNQNKQDEFNGYTADELTRFKQQKQKLSKQSIAILKEMLKKNQQTRTGNKSELIEKIADGIVLGRIPKCPNCFGGRPRFDNKSGLYQCPGFQDDDVYRNCHSVFQKDQLKRQIWES